VNRKDWRLKRISKEIKLKDIAKAIGISDSYLCKYEKNQCDLPHSFVLNYQSYIDNYEGEKE
jgi:transcriptional regulator with XRE-family HTH domain